MHDGHDPHLQLVGPDPFCQVPIPNATSADGGSANSPNRTGMLSRPQATSVNPPSQGRASPVSSHDPGETDAMGAVDGWALRAGLLGASSSANFMRQMRKAVDGKEGPDLGTRGAVSSHVSTRLLQRHQEWKKNLHSPEYVLPPRSTADRLMDIYWKYSFQIFPFLDEMQISECYEGLWTGGQSYLIGQQVFHCILNLAFAIACKLDAAALPGEQEESSSAYFARARKLLLFDLLTISDFHLIQALLLMSQYLQSTDMPRQCFQSIGLAIWIAQVCLVPL